MNPGDIVQVQRRFRVFERELDRRDPKKIQEIVSLVLSPGDIYLLTKLIYHDQEYPHYNYVTIELLVAGRTWITTVTLDQIFELEQFIKVCDHDFENFESPTLR